MLAKIRNIPVRYYQLALLNIGITIAISKEMSLLSIAASLLFVVLTVAPFAVILGLLSPPPHQIVQNQILAKMKEYHSGLVDYLSQWQSLKQQQKQKAIIYILVAMYISINFICPCIQTIVIMNTVFAYFFMHQEVEWIKRFICRLCEQKRLGGN